MTDARLRAVALRDSFVAEGAIAIETPILQPAGLLLDLYGEDIRARAYMTSDALHGEQMLRPDFTVPVVQMHMSNSIEQARYTYVGEVFRRQEDDPNRPNEFLQTGYEIFDRTNPAETDAEVFALLERSVSHLKLSAIIGDIGILMAAVDGLHTTERRKMALRRHIWRPNRFRMLLDRFSGRTAIPNSRQALLNDHISRDVPLIGLRSHSEIQDRVNALKADSAEPPITSVEIDGLDALLKVCDKLPFALKCLRDLAKTIPSISSAVLNLDARIEALISRGIDVEALEFDMNFGRSSMEYYDGFVFGFYSKTRPELPAIASGGRYDALTQRLGNGEEIPAVGGVLRPSLMVDLERSL